MNNTTKVKHTPNSETYTPEHHALARKIGCSCAVLDAAPELVEALKELLTLAETLDNKIIWHNEIVRAKAALEKAGE